jgi:hypothetical protein
MHTHTLAQSHAYTHAHTYSLSRTHTHICTHMRTHTCTLTQTRTHTYTHTHTNTQSVRLLLCAGDGVEEAKSVLSGECEGWRERHCSDPIPLFPSKKVGLLGGQTGQSANMLCSQGNVRVGGSGTAVTPYPCSLLEMWVLLRLHREMAADIYK